MMKQKKDSTRRKPSFFDFFPAPQFLEMPAPGLSISDDGMRVVEFARTKKGYVVQKHGELLFSDPRIRSGVIENTEGFVADLIQIKKTHDLKYIRASLPEERAYVFTTEVVGVAGGDLRTAVESVIEENVPLSVAEAVFDYTVLTSTQKEERQITKVSVSVVAREVVEEYLSAFRTAGLEPLHFDIESQAIAKAVIPRGEVAVNLIINVMKNKVGIYIDDGGAISFASTTPLSSWGSDGTIGDESIAVTETLEAIKKVMLYWQTQEDRKGGALRPFAGIYVVGQMATESRMSERISKKFTVNANVANVWRNIFAFTDYVPPISKEESLSYAAAAGLALPRVVLE